MPVFLAVKGAVSASLFSQIIVVKKRPLGFPFFFSFNFFLPLYSPGTSACHSCLSHCFCHIYLHSSHILASVQFLHMPYLYHHHSSLSLLFLNLGLFQLKTNTLHLYPEEQAQKRCSSYFFLLFPSISFALSSFTFPLLLTTSHASIFLQCRSWSISTYCLGF